MQIYVSGGKGRLIIPNAEVRAIREEFIAHACRAAELAGVEAPPREAFLQDTRNPSYRRP